MAVDGRDDRFFVFLLAGQSNMAGRGALPLDTSTGAHPRVKVFHDGAWHSAAHPLHRDKPHKAGVGPGLAFARCVADFLPQGATVGLIPAAFGGSEIARWHPQTGDLFHSAVALTAEARDGPPWGPEGKLAGVLWHQGESDSGAVAGTTGAYESALAEVVRELPRSCGAGEGCPTVLGELPVHFLNSKGDPRFANATHVNRAIGAVGDKAGPHVGVVSARGLDHRGDRLHFDAASADALGRRYAWRWLQLSGRAHASVSELVACGPVDPPLLGATAATAAAADLCRVAGTVASGDEAAGAGTCAEGGDDAVAAFD